MTSAVLTFNNNFFNNTKPLNDEVSFETVKKQPAKGRTKLYEIIINLTGKELGKSLTVIKIEDESSMTFGKVGSDTVKGK